MTIEWEEIQIPFDQKSAPWLNDERWQKMLCGVLSQCDEKLKRQISGLFSSFLERGGQKKMASITGLDPKTIRRGTNELKENRNVTGDKIRAPGGGRKLSEDKEAGLEKALLKIIEAHKAGDPSNVDVWAGRSLNKLNKKLAAAGYYVSKNTVRRILKKK